MTLNYERINAIKMSRNFMRSLLDPKQTPRVPKYVRSMAGRCLRHYPWDMYVDMYWPKEEDEPRMPKEQDVAELVGAYLLRKGSDWTYRGLTSVIRKAIK